MWNNVESSLFSPSIHTLIKYLLQRRFDSFHSPCTEAVLCQTMIAKHPKKAKMTKISQQIHQKMKYKAAIFHMLYVLPLWKYSLMSVFHALNLSSSYHQSF